MSTKLIYLLLYLIIKFLFETLQNQQQPNHPAAHTAFPLMCPILPGTQLGPPPPPPQTHAGHQMLGPQTVQYIHHHPGNFIYF